jgi:hypothetical protein
VRARLLFVTAYSPVTWLAVVAIGSAALALVWLAATGRWTKLPVVLTCCAVVLLLAIQFGALAGRRPEPVEEMATLIRSHRTGNEPVGAYQVFVRNLPFYTRFSQVELFDEGRALDFMKSRERVLLVIGINDLTRLKAISGVAMKPLGAVHYLEPANIRLRTLLSPMPAQDLELVLLVTNR